jgi:hypothetical protein
MGNEDFGWWNFDVFFARAQRHGYARGMDKSIARIGIDIGKTGCICAIDPNNDPVFYDFEFRDDVIDVDDLFEKLASHDYHEAVLTAELLVPFAALPSTVTFLMGRMQGAVESMIATMAFNTLWLRPGDWKRKYGLLKADKKQSVELARRIANKLDYTLPKRFRHDCAEAFLLAVFPRLEHEKIIGRYDEQIF